jgi:hypothetical protein
LSIRQAASQPSSAGIITLLLKKINFRLKKEKTTTTSAQSKWMFTLRSVLALLFGCMAFIVPPAEYS